MPEPTSFDPIALTWKTLTPEEAEALLASCFTWLNGYIENSRNQKVEINLFASKTEPRLKLAPMMIKIGTKYHDLEETVYLQLITFSLLERLIRSADFTPQGLNCLTVHRLLVFLFYLALKIYAEPFPSLKDYASIVGVSSAELKRAEPELLRLLKWKTQSLDYSPEQLIVALRKIQFPKFEKMRESFETEHPQLMRPPTPLRSCPSMFNERSSMSGLPAGSTVTSEKRPSSKDKPQPLKQKSLFGQCWARFIGGALKKKPSPEQTVSKFSANPLRSDH